MAICIQKLFPGLSNRTAQIERTEIVFSPKLALVALLGALASRKRNKSFFY